MSTATYPLAVKVFTTWHDYTDVIFAMAVNEIHDEVASIETVLGISPFVSTPYATFGGAIQDLYTNKAPANHSHSHHLLEEDADGDDHPQYILVNGTRAFSGPVGGQWATAGNHLLPLSQLQSFGYINVPQAQYLIALAVGNLTRGAYGGAPLFGPNPPAPTWVITGGLAQGCTDGAGNLYAGFGGAFRGMIQAFVATKLPVGGGHPCPPYNYIEAQLTLVGISLAGALVKFSHDYSFQPGLFAAYSWLAIGT